ncbi:hypothetical protein Agub_g4805, partial [Astrephomene gubernaculifera]
MAAEGLHVGSFPEPHGDAGGSQVVPLPDIRDKHNSSSGSGSGKLPYIPERRSGQGDLAPDDAATATAGAGAPTAQSSSHSTTLTFDSGPASVAASSATAPDARLGRPGSLTATAGPGMMAGSQLSSHHHAHHGPGGAGASPLGRMPQGRRHEQGPGPQRGGGGGGSNGSNAVTGAAAGGVGVAAGPGVGALGAGNGLRGVAAARRVPLPGLAVGPSGAGGAAAGGAIGAAGAGGAAAGVAGGGGGAGGAGGSGAAAATAAAGVSRSRSPGGTEAQIGSGPRRPPNGALSSPSAALPPALPNPGISLSVPGCMPALLPAAQPPHHGPMMLSPGAGGGSGPPLAAEMSPHLRTMGGGPGGGPAAAAAGGAGAGAGAGVVLLGVGGPVRPVLGKYTWEPEYQRALLDAALRLPPEAVPAGFMATLSSTLPPPAEAPPLEPDPAALKWFKATYPEAISTSRRDAMAVRLWLDEQFHSLRRHVMAARPHSAPDGGAGAAPAGAGTAAASGAAGGAAPQRGGGNAAAAAASPPLKHHSAPIAPTTTTVTATTTSVTSGAAAGAAAAAGGGRAGASPERSARGGVPQSGGAAAAGAGAGAGAASSPTTAAAAAAAATTSSPHNNNTSSSTAPQPQPQPSHLHVLSPQGAGPGGGGCSSPTAGTAAVAAGGASAVLVGPPSFSGPDSLLLLRDPEGYLDGAVLRHQETLLSRCMEEVAGQVATLCVERGHILALLWQALRHLLYTLLTDRDAARNTALAARRAAAAAAAEKADALSRAEGEKAEMVHMNDLVNRRLLAAKMEAEHVRARHADVEAELARLRAVHPDELRRELDALRVQMSTLERQLAANQMRLERCQLDLAERDKELAAALARVQASADELGSMREEFGARSPRPAQPRTPPWELMQPDEAALTLAGLRAGVPAQDMHRLLLGVSATGGNVLPWCHLLGTCRHIDPSGPPPNAGVGSEGSQLNLGGGGGASTGGTTGAEGGEGSSESPSPQRARLKSGRPTIAEAVAPDSGSPSTPASRATTAVGQRRFNRAMSHKRHDGGELGGPMAAGTMAGPAAVAVAAPPLRAFTATGGASRRSGVLSLLTTPGLPDIREQHNWLYGLLSRPDAATALSRWLSEEAVEAVGQMANHSIDAHSIACLLLGTFSIAGADVVPYKSLAGVLATRYRHTAADIGGSITEALELAAMSTRDRVERLQEINKDLRKQVNKLKRNLSDMRKVERDGRMKDLRNVARKVQGCPPSPLHGLVLQKRCEYFMGLGSGEDVPAVLHAEGKVGGGGRVGKLYNRQMEKAEAERIVNAVWQSKREFEAGYGVRISLPDYLSVFLQRKHGAARPATEAAYNLVYTLGQHQYDPDCYLFFKVLAGELDDSAREGQERLRAAVLDALLAADAAANSNRVTGWLRKSDIRDTLTRLLGVEGSKR